MKAVDILQAEEALLRRLVAGAGLVGMDADDVLQEVSLKALQTTKSWLERHDCVRWLVRVTLNACMTEHRRQGVARRHVSGLWKRQQARPSPRSGASRVMDREQLTLIHEALNQLEQSLLIPLVLRYFCDMNSREIGQLLNISAEAVRGRLYQGRLRLAKTLTKGGLHNES